MEQEGRQQCPERPFSTIVHQMMEQQMQEEGIRQRSMHSEFASLQRREGGQAVEKQSAGYSFSLLSLRSIPRPPRLTQSLKVLLKTDYRMVHWVFRQYFGLKGFGKEDQWSELSLLWVDNYVSEQFVKRLYPHQKVNHFPSSAELGRKDALGRNLNGMRLKYPQQYQFYPKTYILPEDYSRLSEAQAQAYLIAKPYANCQGRGIYLTTRAELTGREQLVIQEYIMNPLLLDGFKFDLRLYVLVQSLCPLKIYLYKEGLGRLATKKYQPPNQSNLNKECMHLTNYAINKLSPQFQGNKGIHADNLGHKRSYTAIMNIIKEQIGNVEQIQTKIQGIIVKTIISVYTKMQSSYEKARKEGMTSEAVSVCPPSAPASASACASASASVTPSIPTASIPTASIPTASIPTPSVCFELLGFDIMLDGNYEPMLLEVNHQPSLTTDSPLDALVKRSLLIDTINVLNIEGGPAQLGAFKMIYPGSKYEHILNRVLYPTTHRSVRLTSRAKKVEVKTPISAYTTMGKFERMQGDEEYVGVTFYNLFSNEKFLIRASPRKRKVPDEGEVSILGVQTPCLKKRCLIEGLSMESAEKVKDIFARDTQKQMLALGRAECFREAIHHQKTENMHRLSRLYVRNHRPFAERRTLTPSGQNKDTLQIDGRKGRTSREDTITQKDKITQKDRITQKDGSRDIQKDKPKEAHLSSHRSSHRSSQRDRIASESPISTTVQEPIIPLNLAGGQVVKYCSRTYDCNVSSRLKRMSNMRLVRNHLERLKESEVTRISIEGISRLAN